MITYITKAKNLFKISLFGIFTSILLSSAVIAQTYSPNDGNFPHNGIKTEVTKGSDNGDGDNDGIDSISDYQDDCVTNGICKYGLQTPSFNNFTDTWVGADKHFDEGTTDERQYFVLRNYTNGDATFTDSISVKSGDIIQGRSYIHNNGTAGNPNTTANNVTFKLPGFHIIGQDATGKNIYESDNESVNGKFYPSHSISASNVIAGTGTISDNAVITATDGKKFKLQYTADSSYVKTVSTYAGHTSPTVNPDNLVSTNGDNIGQVKGCKEESFYLYIAFRVVDATATNYDLAIEKTVEKETIYSTNGNEVEQQNVSAAVGEEVIYKLAYENKITSAATPTGTKIYDKYDTQKLTITWLDTRCTNNATYSATKGLITCNAYDLAPGQKHNFYFKAQIKTGATGTIHNDVEIIPDNDSNPDNNTGTNGDINRNPNDNDTNGANDDSNATVTIPQNTSYDLAVDKHVEKETVYSTNGKKVERKNVNVIAGEEVVYKIIYANTSPSTAIPSGTNLYDKYDTQKLTITWLDPLCTNNPTYSTTKGLITCNAYDLAPGTNHIFYFKAVVKAGATGIINNDVEIIPDNDSNPDNNTGTNGTPNRNPNDLDTNPANDDANATLTVVATPINGTCGNRNTVYPYGTTAYPANTQFCTTGTVDPTNPGFPTTNTPVTWTCNGQNGGTNSGTCQASVSNETPVDITIEKFVNNAENIQANKGDTVTYKLRYQNLTNTKIARNTVIVDDYEESKITIINSSLPIGCTNSNPANKITCIIGDLKKTDGIQEITYQATIKTTVATGQTIKNTVVISTDTPETDNTNNDDEAIITVKPDSINGTCGTGATAYPNGTTAYPANTQFCATGTVNPNPPAFPTTNTPATWTCEGSNEGQNSGTCTATLSDLTPVDIEIKKSVEGKSWPDIHNDKAGERVTYKLEYKNNTQGVIAKNVIIKDYPDTEKIDINSIQFQPEAGVTCEITQDEDALVAVLQGRFIKCTVGDLAYSAQYHTLTYSAKIKDNVSNGTNIDNTVEICTDNPETDDNNNSDHARVKILDEIPEYDLKIEKTVNDKKEDTVAVKSTIQFKLVYENISTSKNTAIDVKIIDTYEKDKIEIIESNLPTGCTNDSTAGKITCILGNLTVGQTGEIVYSAKLLAGFTTGESINIAIITPNPDNDTNSANDSSSAKVKVINPNEYDLTINKLVDGVKNKNVVAGQTLTYTLTYENLTPGTVAKDVKIFDIFDNNNLDEHSVIFTNVPAGVTCAITSDDDPVYYIMTGEHIACTLGDLAYGDAKTITYTIKVNDNVTAGTKIKNTAEIKPNPDNDTNQNNDTSETEVTVTDTIPEYDLEINKTVNTAKEVTVNKNSTVTFKIDYKNLDTSKNTAIDVKIVDTYKKAKIEIVESSLPAACTNDVTHATDGKITCTIGNLTVSQTGSVTYQAKLLPAFTTGETTNNVIITPNPDNDTNQNNDTSSAKIKIKSDGGTTPINGVCGSAATTYAESTTVYPSNSAFCSYGTAIPNPPAFPAQGSSVSWTCQGSNGGTSTSCSAARHAPSGGGGGSSGGGGGSGGGCNTNANIDLNIVKYIKIEGGSFEPAGSRETAARLIKNKKQNAIYKIIISNAGSASAYSVKVKDTFSSSDGVTHGAIHTQSGASYADGVFTLIGGIPANGSREFTYTTTLSNDGNATGVNTAKIQSFTTDYTCPTINSKKGVGRTSVAYVKTAGVAQNAEYILDKTADKHSVKTGDIVTYTLSIKNTGNIDMKNVILTDKFPSEFLEPTERFKKRLINNRTLEFKRKFLPVGDTFSMKVEMIVREGVPQGTEIRNILTGRSDTVDIKDKSMETIIVSEGDTPVCPTGYKWKDDLNTCKKIWTPQKNIQTGLDTPFLPIGIMMLGVAFILRRKDIAEFISTKI